MIPQAITSEKQEENRDEVSVIHKLKLEWMMARDEGERRATSEEIRRILLSSKK